MEAFFDRTLQYHPNEASVCSVTTTSSWPPRIAATGYAPTLRGWTPKGTKMDVSFSPAEELTEVDGYRQVAMSMEGNILASADSTASGNISIWDVSQWKRMQTVQAGAAVASMALSSDILAAGTMNGKVRVYCRPKQAIIDFVPLFEKELTINLSGSPCRTVLIGQAPDGTPILVAHSSDTNAVLVWRLTDGRLVQKLGRPRDASNMQSHLVQTNIQSAMIIGTLLAMVSWIEGSDPMITLLDVLSRQGDIVDAPDRLKGRSKPLCADFDGQTLVVGFQDGAVATFGVSGWLHFHTGAVGAVQLVAGGAQVCSGSADQTVCLWSTQGGGQLSKFDIGFQVTSLSAGDVFAVVGGNRGEIQLVVLAPNTDKPDGEKPQIEAAPSRKADQYVMYFDSRPDKGCISQGDGAQGRVSDQILAFHAFVPPVEIISVDILEAHAVELVEKPQAVGGSKSEEEEGKSSGFNAGASLKGAHVKDDPEAEKARAEEAKKKQLKQMGEGTGVARASDVMLESSTARLGRKCDNTNCLAREGLGGTVFKRCGACRQKWYCSAHCQRTHWRDGHSKECSTLKGKALDDQQAPTPASVTAQDSSRPSQPDATAAPDSSSASQSDATVAPDSSNPSQADATAPLDSSSASQPGAGTDPSTGLIATFDDLDLDAVD